LGSRVQGLGFRALGFGYRVYHAALAALMTRVRRPSSRNERGTTANLQGLGLKVYWEGSTTVAHTVVWRNSKSRGLMYGGKCSAVIGRKNAFFCMCPVWSFRLWVYLKPITALYFPPYFAERQCEQQWLNPPSLWFDIQSLGRELRI